MEAKTIQEALEKRALQKLENEISKDCKNLVEKWRWTGEGDYLKVQLKEKKELYSIDYLMEEIKKAVLEQHYFLYTKEEIHNFIKDVEETKASLDELDNFN